MDKLITMKGQCLCGAVSIQCENIKPELVPCHCSRCRKWSGGPFMGLESTPASKIKIEGEGDLTLYDSSEWAQRAFCKHCGTHLFYRLKNAHHYSFTAGFFDIDESITMTTQIFIEEKPGYYEFANKTRTMTGQEVFDAYATEQ